MTTTFVDRYIADAEGRVYLAAALFARDLMRDDPDTLKAGYTEANACIAAAEVFRLPVDEVNNSLHNEVLAHEAAS